MPELPEVETVRTILHRSLCNRIIDYVEVFYPRMILSDLNEFVAKLKGAKFTDVKRKGKFLLFFLDDDKVLISHLRMEGKYLELTHDEPPTKHCRVLFHLQDGALLNYDDSRCFGIMELRSRDDYLDAPCLKKLGKEPFEITVDELYDRLKNKKVPIKEALLDQTIMTGLGNIYCDEVLFLSKLNPYRLASSLQKEDVKNILKHAISVLNKSIKLGGSTVSSYHPSKGVDGRFQNELMAYGKKNMPCPICHRKMRKDFLKGRGTTYCPHCQHVALRIAITGKIGSGKSAVLQYYKDQGYSTFSADEEVKKLYREVTFKKKLVAQFKEEILNDDGSISLGYLKNVVLCDLNKKKELEKLVHPEIKKRLLQFILSHKEERLIFAEIPLLFESKMDNLFDYIIGVSCSFESQKAHLRERGSSNIEEDLKLNATNIFDKKVQKMDFLINNDGTLEDLYHELDRISKELK